MLLILMSSYGDVMLTNWDELSMRAAIPASRIGSLNSTARRLDVLVTIGTAAMSASWNVHHRWPLSFLRKLARERRRINYIRIYLLSISIMEYEDVDKYQVYKQKNGSHIEVLKSNKLGTDTFTRFESMFSIGNKLEIYKALDSLVLFISCGVTFMCIN